MVTVTLPAGVVEAVVMVIVELFPAVTLGGLKLADAPLGSPLELSETDCAEPLVSAVETVVVPLPPWVTVTVLGLALIEKSLLTVFVTVSDTVVVWVAEVPVPVTVIG
jgi:hypothetical protein